MNLPPEQQFKLPIFKHWRLKINSSYLNFSAQSGSWYRMHNVYHHITMETIHHRTFRVNWTLDKSKGCHIKSVFLWTNLAFQSKHFISKLNPRLTDSALIQKQFIWGKMACPPNIDIREHFRWRGTRLTHWENICEYIWIYIYMNAYIYIYTHTHTHIYIYKHIYTYNISNHF